MMLLRLSCSWRVNGKTHNGSEQTIAEFGAGHTPVLRDGLNQADLCRGQGKTSPSLRPRAWTADSPAMAWLPMPTGVPISM